MGAHDIHDRSRGPGVAAAAPTVPVRVVPVLLGVLALTAPGVAALTHVPDTGMSDLPGAHAVAFLAFALTWSPATRLRGTELRRAAVVVLVGLTVGGWLAGADPLAAALAAGAATLCGGLAGYLAAGRREVSWLPREPAEAIQILAAAALACVVGVLLGAFPGTPPGGSGDLAIDVWNGVRGFVVLAVMSTSVFPLCFAPPVVHTRVVLPWMFPALVVVTVACLAVPFGFPDASLSWIALVPALWAGLTLTPRLVAGFTLAIALALVYVPVSAVQDGQAHLFSPGLGTDLLIACIAHAALQIAVMREQAARIRAELTERAAQVNAQHAVLRSILDTMSDALLVTDDRGVLTLSNPAARSLLGPLPRRVGRRWGEQLRLHPDDLDRLGGAVAHGVHAQVDPLRRAGVEQATDVRRVLQAFEVTRTLDERSGPSPQHLRVTTSNLGEAGRGRRLFIVRDVSGDHVRQKELESFAGTVAHDLKGPLTGLRGWLEAARDEVDDGDPESAAVAVRRAGEATDRMAALVDDMLVHTVTQEGTLRLEDIALAEAVPDLVGLYAGTGATISHDTPHTVRADRALLRQLLANLVGNSIKYTRVGEPAVVEIASYDGDPGWVEIEVSDQGRGLQPGDEEKIFEAFDRSAKDAGSVQGIGLGLSLCHAIVTRHGGRIGAENNEWGGATFMLTVPAAP